MLTDRIDSHSKGDTRSRIFIPPGIISRLPLCKNVNFLNLPNRLTYILLQNLILNYWRFCGIMGNLYHLILGEILDRTGSQSAYANHNKLSFSIWDLVASDRQGRRKITNKGIAFINGKEVIPKTIIENKNTRVCSPASGSPLLLVEDETDLFGDTVKSFKEVKSPK